MKNNNMPLHSFARRAAPAAALALLLAACSSTQGLPDVDRVFLSAAGNWDRNRDGVVTCDEWKAYAAELFDSADSNRDGFLDRTEYAKVVSTDRMFETVDLSYYDADKDGKASRAEFIEKPNRAFALLDKSNECKLTANQVAGARAHSEQIFDSKKAESGDPREKATPGMPN
jgi:Ca2+-binding EF-hand superfamily protein